MNTKAVASFIAQRHKSCYANEVFTSNINDWLLWYKGYVPRFHSILVDNGESVTRRDIFRLNMAKRVCEDWASSVFSDELQLTISSSNKRSSVFIQGSKGNGGVLGSNQFESLLPQVLEETFALGTSAIVLGLENASVDTDNYLVVNENCKIVLQSYDATRVFPISWKNGRIYECAFVSEYTVGKETFTTVSVHVKESDGYVIYNYTLRGTSNYSILTQGSLSVVRTRSEKPLFVIFKTNLVNNIDLNCPLGISIYANAISNLKGCDTVYDKCVREVITGQRVVFMNRSCLKMGMDGRLITPQQGDQSYLMYFGDDASRDINEWVKEFHPTLNTDLLDKELQNQLNMLSTQVGLGKNYYKFDSSGHVTATEYVGSEGDFIKNSNKMAKLVKSAIIELVKEALWLGKNAIGIAVDTDAKIDLMLTDGVIEDDSKKREADRADVSNGMMSKVEYRMKWYGESGIEATQALYAAGQLELERAKILVKYYGGTETDLGKLVSSD